LRSLDEAESLILVLFFFGSFLNRGEGYSLEIIDSVMRAFVRVGAELALHSGLVVNLQVLAPQARSEDCRPVGNN